MKIIKSLLLLAVCFCTATMLYAQEPKAEIAKPIEIKIPAVANNKPSPQPGLKQQPQVDVIALEAPPVAIETASPLKKDKDSKPVQNMTAEQAKILAGKTERPKEPIAVVPATTAPAPVAVKAPGNQ